MGAGEWESESMENQLTRKDLSVDFEASSTLFFKNPMLMAIHDS